MDSRLRGAAQRTHVQRARQLADDAPEGSAGFLDHFAWAKVGRKVVERWWRRHPANAATQLTTTASVRIEGAELPAGKYSLWTLPSRTGVQLIINRQSGQWGTNYDASQDLGHVPLTVGSHKVPLERFTMTVEPTTKNSGNLALEWGNFRWTVPIVVK